MANVIIETSQRMESRLCELILQTSDYTRQSNLIQRWITLRDKRLRVQANPGEAIDLAALIHVNKVIFQ